MNFVNPLSDNGSVNTRNNGSCVSVNEYHSSLLGSSQRASELTGYLSRDLCFLSGLRRATVKLSYLRCPCRGYIMRVRLQPRVGIRFPVGPRDFSLFHKIQTTLGPIQLVPGIVSPGVKRRGPEVDHSPLSSAEVKNDGAMPPLSHTSSWRGV
jgi:hypothetical protein